MFRKRQTLGERLTRHRGAICVVLLLVVLLGLYRSSGDMQQTQVMTLTTRETSSGISQPSRGKGNVAPDRQYVVVFDAGSSGTRVHVFEFEIQPNVPPKLIVDHYQANKGPGLSQFTSAEDAVDSMRPLLEYAQQKVPHPLQADTPVVLRATAGLRMMKPQEAADKIVEGVTTLLKESGLRMDDDGVAIMEGSDEGKYQWVSVNYLLGRLGPNAAAPTVGILDMGGGSVQQAYATPQAGHGKTAEQYIKPVTAMGQQYHVYVYSYNGYGLNAARSTILSKGGLETCMPRDAVGEVAYNEQHIKLEPSPKGTDLEGCRKVVLSSLEKGKECGADVPKTECSFAGAWGGPAASRAKGEVLAGSFFWDRALGTGVAEGDTDKLLTVRQQDFADKAAEVCSKSVQDLNQDYPNLRTVSTTDKSCMCLDLLYAATVLTDGMGLQAEQEFKLVKQVVYNNTKTEAAWPLGLAIESMSKANHQ